MTLRFSSTAWRRSLLGLLLAGLFALLWTVARQAGPLAPTRVTVAPAGEGTLTPALFGIGTVEARRSYLIGPTVAGRVRSVRVDVGDLVKAGQLLAEIEPVDLDQRIAAIDASVARADSAMSAAQALLRDAQARQVLASVNARRYQDLGAQNFISPGAVEARLQELASADASVGAAAANLASAGQDRQRLVAERAGLRQQQLQLRLTAPADSLVTSREAEAGSTVLAGQAVLRLLDPSTLWVRVRLDPHRSDGLVPGLPARIALRSRPDRSLPGEVARVEPVSDSVTEERIALVRFTPLPTGLTAGELAEVSVLLPATPRTVMVPNAAIRRRQGQTGVWSLQDGGALQFLPVLTGQASLEGQVQVLQGLTPGLTVIVHSEKEITPQSRIQVVPQLTGPRP